MPRVSVIMASYNHAQFIERAIGSILNQTMRDLELIIVDDGSNDSSNSIIASVEDERVYHIPLSPNAGACNAMNIAIARAKGDFIAVCNSDDIWEENKLTLQLDKLISMPSVAAIFSDVTWIDENDAQVIPSVVADIDQFRQENKSRQAWLRQIIESDNCLCHPSVLLRREVYGQIGLLDNMLRQLPDLDLWIRLLQHFDIYVMPEKLVRFRIHQNNTSRPSPAKQNRLRREHFLITKRFFNDVSPENFYGSLLPDSPDSADTETSVRFCRDKVNYLLNARWGSSSDLQELALEVAYFGSIANGIEIIPALNFHNLTASPIDPPIWPVMKRNAGKALRVITGERTGQIVTGFVKKITAR
ncbi:glycosyltransferase [Sphingomonas faeni]|uniref:glycosyltransferase n=1 Tax=Sphingomonas faeni TaxID=185950 RepID=UPI00277F0DDB|nr:glycosyltransferase [Sphingomonas faeni]MDQ0839827.1 glycosyltransferase involved in cell wall biosynthesis [Sphingomonas faeni]